MSGNVYLTGVMGTGKTTLGPLLARRLGRPFADLDAEAEAAAGLSVAEIFARRGEQYFRALEKKVLSRLCARSRGVVSLGGGALLDPESRRRVAASGTLVRLTCSQRELWRRLKPQRAGRPLLAGGRQALAALIARRRGLYDGCALGFSTTGKSPQRAANALADRLKKKGLA